MESSSSSRILQVDDIVFRDVKPGKTYTNQVKIKNASSIPVDFSIRGSKTRYQIEPEMVPVLEPGESVLIKVTLRVPDSGSAKQKNTDTFSIRSKYFSQRFSSTWYMRNSNDKPSSFIKEDITSVFSAERESWRKELLSQLDSANMKLSRMMADHQREISEIRLEYEEKSQKTLASCLAKDREIEELKEKNRKFQEKSRKQLQLLQRERDESRQELQGLKTQTAQSERQNEAKIKSLTTQNESLRARLQAATSIRPTENKALREQLDRVEQDLEKESARYAKLETESIKRMSDLKEKLKQAEEKSNPTEREKRLEDKIRALHDVMRLVGISSEDDVSVVTTDDDDDITSVVFENNPDARRVVFAQAFEILKLRQRLVTIQSHYTEDIRKFENRIRKQRNRVLALRSRVAVSSSDATTTKTTTTQETTTMRAMEEQIKILKLDLASSKRQVLTYRAAFTYVNIPGISVSKMIDVVRANRESSDSKSIITGDSILHDDDDDDDHNINTLTPDYALKLLSEITKTASSKSSTTLKSTKSLAKEIRRIVHVATNLESSLQRQKDESLKWKRAVLKTRFETSAEMLSCEESNARRAHILQDALRNEESRSRRLEENLAGVRAEIAHERHLRVVLEKKAEERARKYESAESSLRVEMEELRKRSGALKIEAMSAMESLRERTMQVDVLRDTLSAFEDRDGGNDESLHKRVASLTTQFVTQKSISGELQIELNRLRNVAIDVTSRERLRRRRERRRREDGDVLSSQLALKQVPVLRRRLDEVQDDLIAEQRECVRLRQVLVGVKADAKIARAQLQVRIEGEESVQFEEKRRLEVALRELEEQHREFVSESNNREMAALESGTSRIKSLLRELEAMERSALIEEYRRKRCEDEIVRLRKELETKTKIENMLLSAKTSITIRESRALEWEKQFLKWKEGQDRQNIQLIQLFASETERDHLIHRLRNERKSHVETIAKLMKILEEAGKLELDTSRQPPEDLIFITSPSDELAASLASARATIGEMERQAVRWRRCYTTSSSLSSSTESKESDVVVKTLTREIAEHVASSAKFRVKIRMLRDELGIKEIAMRELRDVVTKLKNKFSSSSVAAAADDTLDIERELWCRVMESNFREAAMRKQLRDASCVEIELRERITRLERINDDDDDDSFESTSPTSQNLLNAYLETNRKLIELNCELNLEKVKRAKESRDQLKHQSHDDESDMKAVLQWLKRSKLEAKKKQQLEEKILDRVKRAERVADTVPRRIVAAEHRIRKLLERDQNELKHVREELVLTVKRLEQERTRCSTIQNQFESAQSALDEMKRVVEIAERRFRKMKNRVTSFKETQQQYEEEMKKRDNIEKQLHDRVKNLTQELENEREKNEDVLLEEIQRADEEVRRRNEEWKTEHDTKWQKQAEELDHTRRELEDTRQRYEIAEKQCTRASFAIAELASLACRVKSSVEEEEIHDDFELNIRRTRNTLETCAVMQSKLKQLKSSMKKSQNQNKLSTATETSLRKQLNDAIRKFETLKEDRNKRKSDSNRRVRELKMSLSRKSKLLDASKTRVEELEAELLSLRTKHKSLRSRVERSENSMSRRENLAKDTQKRFTEIGKDLKSHKEELAACKSRLKAEISALKSCRSRNESLREEIARLREKKVSEKKKTSSSPKKNNTLKRLRDEMYRVQASERAARSQVKTLSSELKKQKLRVSELVSDATARAKRFDEDLKRTIDAEKQKLQELRTATESISEAVVAMFAALLARNARLHKGLSRHRKDMEETEEDKREDEDVWTLRERHQEILKAVQNAVDRRPPDELTLQVLLAETVQERVRVQSARDVLLRDSSSSLNGDDDVGSVIRRYEELVEELRGRLSVERVSSRLAIEKYEAQLSALKLRQSSSSVMS